MIVLASSSGIGLLRLAGVPTRYAAGLSFLSIKLSLGTSSLKSATPSFTLVVSFYCFSNSASIETNKRIVPCSFFLLLHPLQLISHACRAAPCSFFLLLLLWSSNSPRCFSSLLGLVVSFYCFSLSWEQSTLSPSTKSRLVVSFYCFKTKFGERLFIPALVGLVVSFYCFW